MVKGYGRKTRRSIATCRYSEEVADLLARRIKKMPEYSHYEIDAFGPLGLGAESHVSVKDGDEIIGWLSIKDDNHGNWVYTDYGKPSKETYPDGSIGALNGFNNPTSPLPTDINEAIALVFKRNE